MAKLPEVRIPPMLLFTVAFFAGYWWNLRQPGPILGDEFRILRLVLLLAGTFLVSFGLVVFTSSMLTLLRARTTILLQRPTTQIVTRGPYDWSRNPMYVAFVAIYVGMSFLANTYWPLILLPIVILALLRFVIAREERYLSDVFAHTYQEYMKQTRRWV